MASNAFVVETRREIAGNICKKERTLALHGIHRHSKAQQQQQQQHTFAPFSGLRAPYDGNSERTSSNERAYECTKTTNNRKSFSTKLIYYYFPGLHFSCFGFIVMIMCCVALCFAVLCCAAVRVRVRVQMYECEYEYEQDCVCVCIYSNHK